MSLCGQCDQPLPEGARFCATCGTPVPVASGSPADGPTAAPPPAPDVPGPAAAKTTAAKSTRASLLVTVTVLLGALFAGGAVTWLLLHRTPAPVQVVKEFVSAPCDSYQTLTFVDDANRQSWLNFGATCAQAGSFSSIQVSFIGDKLDSWQTTDHACLGDPPVTAEAFGAVRTAFTWLDSAGSFQRFDGVTCVVRQSGSWYVYTTGH